MPFIPDCCIRTIIKKEAFKDPVKRGGDIEDNDQKIQLANIGYAKCGCGNEWQLKWSIVKQRKYPPLYITSVPEGKPTTNEAMDDCCVRSVAASNAFAGVRTGPDGNSAAHLWCDCGNHWQLGWVLVKKGEHYEPA